MSEFHFLNFPLEAAAIEMQWRMASSSQQVALNSGGGKFDVINILLNLFMAFQVPLHQQSIEGPLPFCFTTKEMH